MKNLLVIVFVFIVSLSNVFGTAQIPDVILYEGKEYIMHSNPLNDYFKKNPDKYPESTIRSTALWRGYRATFEVKDNALYVKDIQILSRGADEWKSVLKESSPDGKPFKVDWYTGILVIPHGKMVRYVHMGYGSTYEKYILLEIKDGKINAEKKLDNKEYVKFKEKQFEAFKKTEEYKKIIADLKKDKEMSEEFIEGFLKNFIIDYSSKFLDE